MKAGKFLGLLCALLIVHSCSKKSQADFNSNPDLYKEFITGYTSGIVSVSSDVRVQLAFSKKEWTPGDELDSGLFDISPSVGGKVKALSKNTIAFIPEKKLDPNTVYQIKLKLGEIIKTPKELSEFKFTIKTIKQDFVVNTDDLQSYSKEYQYLNATLKTADGLSFEDAQKLVIARQDGKPLKVKFDKNKSTATEFKFVVDSIARPEDDGEIEIFWDGDPADIDRKGSLKFPISGRNSFKVLQIEVGDENNQTLLINFSDPLDKDQDFSGLVAIEKSENLRFATEGNVLKVFYDNVNAPQSTESDYSYGSEETASSERLVEVFQGIRNSDGQKMKKSYSQKLLFEQIKPGVRLVKSGNILPSSTNLKLNFEAASLKQVDVKIYKIYKNNIMQFLQDNKLNGSRNLKQVAQPIAKKTITLKQNTILNYLKWNTYALDLSKIINVEPGAIYRVEFSFKKKYSLYKCSGSSTSESDSEEEEENEDDVNYSGENYDDYYYYEEDYDWQADADACSDYYYHRSRTATNLLASDIGVIAKRGLDKSYLIAANNILTTEPITGATVELYNYQQQKIASGATGTDGTATFRPNKYAYFAIVTKDKQSTYLKLDDELSLSVSNFDVSGETLQKGLKGYIYGERGVWRPGDNIYLSFILNDNANKLPANHPIKLRVTDARGKVTFQTVQTHNALNHYKFVVPTAMDAPTGSWEAVVNVGGARFYKNIKVETIKPNRLKIKNSFNGTFLSASKENSNTIQVTWLHGAIAKDLKTEVQMKVSQQPTSFKGYDNYNFDDATRTFYDEEINLFSGKVNQNGMATFSIKPNIASYSPGMLRAAFITKVYEAGGDVSTDVSSVDFSPYSTYIGIKEPEGNRYGMLETGKTNRFEIASVNENGSAAANASIDVYVYRLESRWWWDASSDNLSRYSNGTSITPYKQFKATTNASGKTFVNLNIPEDDWGRYLIRAVESDGGHATSQTVFIDWPSWSGKTRQTDGQSATILMFSTDKKKYSVGEKAKIFFPSSAGGRALISIENGTKVLKTLWAKTQKGETQVELPIEAAMAPNVYINITLLQPHANTINDSPIRLYGVVPIEVVDKNTILEPQLSMPSELKPAQTATLKVSEKNGRGMSYTIAIVDEGLLDLTRFKTPNAWDAFYVKEALGVRTWDIYDDVIGAYGGKINQVFGIGGDAALGGGKAKKANRFKPVVMYLGPFKLESGQTQTHKVTLPRYIGSVRTMIVAANANTGAYGSVEKTTPVRSPLMVLASLPRKITPSEKVTLPVTVFAMKENVKNVKVEIKTSNNIRIVGNAAQTLTFDRPDEKMAYFSLAVNSATGIGKVQVIATSGNEKSTYDVELDVMNPNPVTNTYSDVILGPNSSKTIAWEGFGERSSIKAALEVSSVPMIDLNRRLKYLIEYPHGCVEQTTSSVFPQLYLADIMDIEPTRKQSIQRNVTAGIQRLNSFQLASGGIVYWPGNSYADDWGTSYAGHFMIEAEKKGYVLPIGFKQKWISYQQRTAKQWRYEPQYGNDLAQSYRLYTLALAGSPDLASMNRLRETAGISNESKLRLAATYALVKQSSAGLALLSKSKIDEYDGHYWYYGSEDRNRAMALETLILLGQKKQAFAMANKLAKEMSSNRWMSTQTTAYSLYAMSQFAQSNGGGGLELEYAENGKNISIKTAKSLAGRSLVAKPGKNSITLRNTKGNTVYVRVLNSGILPVGKELAGQRNLKIATVFKDRKGNSVNVSKIKQGTEFIAEIWVTNQTNEYVDNVALTQILPSGFEIVNTRYTDYGSSTQNTADYIDIRDDRANYYFGLKAGESKKFSMLVNASYLGAYYLPGLQCEAMYDNDYLARNKGMWIEVLR
ncbi:hypothetical protein HUK80_11580 [Flavobacterium sp. MAH-1]|uniref:Alpha-2-macroglobulin family N-terminal region n=1 Tax=Flavobacterium agri TaxID=2743471 RepID=A0A7Y9C613_9FLAO|nr:MG2 domain-containing protein [Flavobacterium agri]NUY81541.1 hypothetical protein [Flavobacterium agri]NYA71565.1 hypothetical protein [Flavobacterium agri]